VHIAFIAMSGVRAASEELNRIGLTLSSDLPNRPWCRTRRAVDCDPPNPVPVFGRVSPTARLANLVTLLLEGHLDPSLV
jgi:hypothetical protein